MTYLNLFFFIFLFWNKLIIKLGCCRLFDRFYRINPNAVKANPFGVRLPAADIFASIEELKVLIPFPDKISICTYNRRIFPAVNFQFHVYILQPRNVTWGVHTYMPNKLRKILRSGYGIGFAPDFIIHKVVPNSVEILFLPKFLFSLVIKAKSLFYTDTR